MAVIPKILAIINKTTGMRFVAVARVTDTQWTACSVLDHLDFGLQAGGELELKTTICDEIRQSGKGVIIDNVTEDPLYCKHKTPGLYGFKSYISLPIILKNGDFFGTLCAIDPEQKMLNTPEVIDMFEIYADLIANDISLAEELSEQKEKLSIEIEVADLRDKFIAVLGHDLRNPITAINMAGYMIKLTSDRTQLTDLGNIIQNSALRMKDLVENMLDFARGKLGEGLQLELHENCDLEPVIKDVVIEQTMAAPGALVKTALKHKIHPDVDDKRISQLLSNLVGNAIRYGTEGQAIWIKTDEDQDYFYLSVSNKGLPIPEKIKEKLFLPFVRGSHALDSKGLGLGLYIASEIAKAHKGELSLIQNAGEITFTLKVPLHADQV